MEVRPAPPRRGSAAVAAQSAGDPADLQRQPVFLRMNPGGPQHRAGRADPTRPADRIHPLDSMGLEAAGCSAAGPAQRLDAPAFPAWGGGLRRASGGLPAGPTAALSVGASSVPGGMSALSMPGMSGSAPRGPARAEPTSAPRGPRRLGRPRRVSADSSPQIAPNEPPSSQRGRRDAQLVRVVCLACPAACPVAAGMAAPPETAPPPDPPARIDSFSASAGRGPPPAHRRPLLSSGP